MNILYLCDEYPQCLNGGIGTATQILAREIIKKGHNVYVHGFYPYYRKALPFEEDKGVKVFRHFYGNRLFLKVSENAILGKIFNIKFKFYEYINEIKNFIKNYKIDIIEIPSYNESFRYSGPHIIKFPNFKIPTIVKYHGSYTNIYNSNQRTKLSNLIYSKESILINSANKIIAVSEYTKNNIIDLFNPKNKIVVIYNGVNTNNSVHYNKSLNKNIVTFAGTISENKGVFNLLKAWKLVISKMPSAKLNIYGKGKETQSHIINQILNDSVRPTVEFKGFVSGKALQNIYLNSSCSIFPSFRENFSMAPMEAMLVGCPTIFTKRTSGNELIRDGVDGLLIDPENITEISEAILLLLTNRKYAIEIGNKGKKKIEDKFNISIIAEEHLSLYKGVSNILTN